MAHRQELLKRRLVAFLRQYGRKRQPGRDANDRQYDRDLERELKRMDPAEVSRLMHDEDDDDDET